MGAYDDLIPGAKPATPSFGGYADLVPQEQGDFFRGAKVALGQTMPIAKGVVGLAGATAENALGADTMLGKAAGGLKDWGLKGYTEGMQKLQPLQKDTDELTTAWDKAKDGNIGALVDWAQYGLGYALGQGGEALATSLLGGVAGAVMAPEAAPLTAAGGAITGLVAKGAVKSAAVSLIEKAVLKEATALMAASGQITAEQAVKQATKSIVKDIGSTSALLAYGGAQELGSIYPEAVAEAEKKGETLSGADLARVWAYGLAAGGVEGLTDKLGVSALTGKVKIPGATTRLGGAAVAGLGGAVVEGGTEAAQTVLERLGAGQEVGSPEGIKDIINSAGLGAIGGGGIGAGTGILHGKRQQVAQDAIKAIDNAETGEQAIDAALGSQMPIVMPQGLDAEGALARMERVRDQDVKDLRDFSGRTPDVVKPITATSAPGEQPSAAGQNASTTPGSDVKSASAVEVPEEPFSDRLLTLREQVSDSRVRQQVRDTLGPDALNDILYYSQKADDENLPGRTSDNMLALAESILSRAQVQPLERTVMKQQKREQQALKAAEAPKQIGLDTTPTGTVTVDTAGNAAPQTRADAVSLADRARAMKQRRSGMTEQAPQGREAGAGVMVGEGTLTPAAVRPEAAQLEAPPNMPGKRGAFIAAEAEAAQRKAGEVEQIPGIAAEQNTTAAAVKRAANAPAPTAMELAMRTAIDRNAHQAAESPHNELSLPTNEQAKVGNYQMGHDRVTFPGLDISIENPAGSTRRDKNNVPPKWETLMEHHYGYVRGTVGFDKDHVDVFIKPGTPEGHTGPVFVVDQQDPKTGAYDEHKAMLGFDNIEEARDAYHANYERDWKGMQAITPMAYEDFKAWVKSDAPKKGPLAAPSTPAERLNLTDGSPITGTTTAGATLAGEFAGYARDGVQAKPNAAAQAVQAETPTPKPRASAPAAAAPTQGEPRAPEQVTRQQGPAAEHPSRDSGRQTPEAGSGDRVQRPASEPHGQGKGQREAQASTAPQSLKNRAEAMKPAAPAKPTQATIELRKRVAVLEKLKACLS